MGDENITEQDLSCACTHGRTKIIAPSLQWCVVCGAIRKPNQENWEFPESHMLVHKLLGAAGVPVIAAEHGLPVPENQLKTFSRVIDKVIEAFTGHRDAEVKE